VLEELLPREWLEAIDVDGLSQGTLVVVVSDASVCTAMRRRVPRLQRQLALRMPTLRRLVVQSSAQP